MSDDTELPKERHVDAPKEHLPKQHVEEVRLPVMPSVFSADDISTAARLGDSVPGQIVLEVVKRQYRYAMLGLILGLTSIVGGIILGLHGVAGSTSWTARILCVTESKLNDAAPGAVLFLVGLFMIIATRPRTMIGKLK